MNTSFAYSALVLSTYIAHFASAQPQSDNIFLDRKFWTKDITIEQINEKIKEGHDLSASNRGNFDGFYFAFNAGASNDVLKYIVEHPGNGVHKPSHDGRTNLFWVAAGNNTEMVEYFLKNGAKTDIIDEKGSTVLLFTASNGGNKQEIYDLLIKYGSQIKAEKLRSGANVILAYAQHAKDLSLLDYFDKKGASFKSKDDEGNGIIEYAIQGGNTAIVKELIAKRKVKPANNNAVLFAANGQRGKQSKLEVYTFIENELKLPLNTLNSNGQNALHILAGKVVDADVLSFLTKKIDVYQKDNKLNTPLFYAARNLKDVKALETVLSWYNNELTHSNGIGASPLLYAIEGNTAEVIEFLLDNKGDLTVVDQKGNNYVNYLIEGMGRQVSPDFKKKVDVLVKNGMTFDSKQANGNTIYHLLAQRGDVKLMEYFLPIAKGDMNAKNDMGLTPLHIIALNAKKVSDIESWLKLGFNKDIASDMDETVYQLAIENELINKDIQKLDFLK